MKKIQLAFILFLWFSLPAFSQVIETSDLSVIENADAFLMVSFLHFVFSESDPARAPAADLPQFPAACPDAGPFFVWFVGKTVADLFRDPVHRLTSASRCGFAFSV